MRTLDRRQAFTLIELLVVVAIITLLIAILLPSLKRARDTAYISVCASNQHQLMTAWFMYASDNHGSLVNSTTIADAPWAYYNNVTGNSVSDITEGALYKYVNDVGVYHCPADDRNDRFNGSNSVPWPPYLRSYSISAYVGDLTNSSSLRKLTDIKWSSRTLVMLGEPDPRGSNWGSWNPGGWWLDWPAAWHLVGVNTAFADGHVEYYRHQDSFTATITWFGTPAPGSPDVDHFKRIYQPK